MSARVEPCSSVRRRAATWTWPGCGRKACTWGANAARRPANASMVIAAARSARSSNSSSRASASTPVASICAVPLLSASPSFKPSVTGASPARRRASSPGRRSPPKKASPPPSSTRARCDSGARSPDAPTEPSCGTTGTTPALSIAASACRVATRMPECPRSKVLMRMHSIARTTSAANGSPTHTAWVTIRLCCSCSRSRPSAGSSLSALLPKPVEIPYSGSPRATCAARKSAARATARSAPGSSSTAAPRATASNCARVSELPSRRTAVMRAPSARRPRAPPRRPRIVRRDAGP